MTAASSNLASFTQDYAAAKLVLQAISVIDDVRAKVEFNRARYDDQELADGLWLGQSYCAEAVSCLPEPHAARTALLLAQVMLAADALQLALGGQTMYLLGDAEGRNKIDDMLEQAAEALPEYRGKAVVEYWPRRGGGDVNGNAR